VGASFNYRRYDYSQSIERVKQLFADAVEESLYEDGNNYSGAIGMLGRVSEFRDKELPDRAAAENFLMDNHEKWSDAMAVSFVDSDGKKCWMVGGWCSA
jgi:hypothetical protein